jgi:hypothetical protein
MAGNAETRGKQDWKLRWYHKHAKADVVLALIIYERLSI